MLYEKLSCFSQLYRRVKGAGNHNVLPIKFKNKV